MATHSSILMENPMDRGAWQAMVHRVTESRTRLKRLSTHAHTDKSHLTAEVLYFFQGGGPSASSHTDFHSACEFIPTGGSSELPAPSWV